MEKLLKVAEFLIDNLKTGKHTMDIEGFLLVSGFALLVVLVGWANQITSKSKETKDLEADFLKKAKLKRADYKKIVNEGGATEDSFKTLVDFLIQKRKKTSKFLRKLNSSKRILKSLIKSIVCDFGFFCG